VLSLLTTNVLILSPGDAAMIAGYVGKSDAPDEALTKFAFAYSEQNDRDYAELKKAARRTHRITVSKVS
jgi:hypothetical protein